jgi:uncharacterized protein with HEPN domain
MSRHDDADRLRHLLEAARKAVALAAGKARVDIEVDEVVQLALARLLEIVGEAAGKVTPAYRDAHSEIPWAAMGGLRNRLAHAYFDVDLDVLLDTSSRTISPPSSGRSRGCCPATTRPADGAELPGGERQPLLLPPTGVEPRSPPAARRARGGGLGAHPSRVY